MADVECEGFLQVADGTVIPVYRSDLAEGTLEEVQTDADFTTSAQSIGDYRAGARIVGGYIAVANAFGYAYVERQGQPLTLIMGGKAGVTGTGCKPCKPVTLQAGDKLKVMAQTASSRVLNIGVWCASGTQRIFTVTGASGSVTPVDSITSNGLGNTLENEVIKQMYMSSIDATKNTSASGVVTINASGAPVGAIAASNTTSEAANWCAVNIPVKLNYAFSCTFSS